MRWLLHFLGLHCTSPAPAPDLERLREASTQHDRAVRSANLGAQEAIYQGRKNTTLARLDFDQRTRRLMQMEDDLLAIVKVKNHAD